MTLLDAVADLDAPRVSVTSTSRSSTSSTTPPAPAPRTLFCCVPAVPHDGHDFTPAPRRGRCGGPAGASGRSTCRSPGRRGRQPARPWPRGRRRVRPPVAHDGRRRASPAPTARPPRRTCCANILEPAAAAPRCSARSPGTRTTPEAPELQRTLAGWRDDGPRAVAMEVSSHALDLHRVDGTRFAVGGVHQPQPRPPRLPRHHGERTSRPRPASSTPDLVRSRRGQPRQPLRAAPRRHRGDPAERLSRSPTPRSSVLDATGSSVPLARPRRPPRTRRGRSTSPTPSPRPTPPPRSGSTTPPSPRLSRAVVVPGRFELGRRRPAVPGRRRLRPHARRAGAAPRRGRRPPPEGPDGSRPGGGRVRLRRRPRPEQAPAMGEVAATRADVVVLTSDNSRRRGHRSHHRGRATGFRACARPAGPVDLVVEPDRRAAIAVALARGRARRRRGAWPGRATRPPRTSVGSSRPSTIGWSPPRNWAADRGGGRDPPPRRRRGGARRLADRHPTADRQSSSDARSASRSARTVPRATSPRRAPRRWVASPSSVAAHPRLG